MRIKIIGIGKCGVRIAYDLFAYTNDFPSAYEIRVDSPSGSLKNLFSLSRDSPLGRHISSIRASIKRLVSDDSGLYRIHDRPAYVTIDSDSENNEIVNRSVKIGTVSDSDSDRVVQFPGVNYKLKDHDGGCNFHVVSESLARTWESVPTDITDSIEIDIYVISFSIAGGTGGGSAPIICQLSRSIRPESGPICHYMGLGILPKSDEIYDESDALLTMPDYEKFSTGRFLASIYANRVSGTMNSLWLFSNDVLRFLVDQQSDHGNLAGPGGEMKLNLSLVNYFVAQSLTVLANSSSSLTSADTNLDPRELNDYFAGLPFVSALAEEPVDDGSDLATHVLSVKKLMLRALTNVTRRDGRLEGLSVPVPTDKLRALEGVLSDESSERDDFVRDLAGYSIDDGPIEFRTTYRLIVLYGQPTTRPSEAKKDLVARACEAFFSNSQKLVFTFRHHGSSDILMLFLVDPLIRSVVSSIYYYANNAWSGSGRNLRKEFDALIAESVFEEPDFLEATEIFPEFVYGGGTEEVVQRVRKYAGLALEREHITETFRHLHAIYQRNRRDMNTTSGLM